MNEQDKDPRTTLRGIKEQFDYTKWQRAYFDRIPPTQFHEEAVAYAKEHPYQGKAQEIIE